MFYVFGAILPDLGKNRPPWRDGPLSATHFSVIALMLVSSWLKLFTLFFPEGG